MRFTTPLSIFLALGSLSLSTSYHDHDLYARSDYDSFDRRGLSDYELDLHDRDLHDEDIDIALARRSLVEARDHLHSLLHRRDGSNGVRQSGKSCPTCGNTDAVWLITSTVSGRMHRVFICKHKNAAGQMCNHQWGSQVQ